MVKEEKMNNGCGRFMGTLAASCIQNVVVLSSIVWHATKPNIFILLFKVHSVFKVAKNKS